VLALFTGQAAGHEKSTQPRVARILDKLLGTTNARLELTTLGPVVAASQQRFQIVVGVRIVRGGSEENGTRRATLQATVSRERTSTWAVTDVKLITGPD
jgi:hypothetical protein